MYLALNNDLIRTRILNSDMLKINNWAVKWKVNFNAEKTELLDVCKRNVFLNNQLSFQDSILQSNTSHKHLGLILQGNCKWDSHVTSIIAKCRTLVACLKSYKYRLNRKSLEIMYKSFILPHFDYADVVWDNLTQVQIENLENIQLEALRTIIGTVRGTSHELIYKESGFVPLKIRRERHKLILFFKFVNGFLPDHLASKFPELVSDQNPYQVRRPFDRQPPRWTSELYHKSYFPSATSLWNQLPNNIQSLNSISAFKNYLVRDDPKVPLFFYSGERIPQIQHCRLRLRMSNLNSDLFRRHLTDDKRCSCGYKDENAKHFLLDCPLHNNTRCLTLFNLPPLSRDCDTLLNGRHEFSLAFNTYIVLVVCEFITLSRRFED